MRENQYQGRLIKTLYDILPGCLVLKNDPNYIQGIPDLIVLWNRRWGALEVKRSLHEPFQPNQEWYLDQMHEMSFAASICPENEEEVLRALQTALGTRRQARNPKSKQR